MQIQLQVQNQLFSGGAGIGSSAPPVPPSAPSNMDIDANNSTENSVILTWTNNGGATTNQIWRSTDNITYNLFDTVGGNVSTYTDASGGMADGDVRYYKVRAVNGAGNSAFTANAAAAKNLGILGLAAYAYATLVVIFGDFAPTSTNTVTDVNFPKLRRIDGAFNMPGASSLTGISVPVLKTLESNLAVTSAPITVLEFPELAGNVSSISLSGCPNVLSMKLPKVQTSDTINISGTGVSATFSLALSALTSLGSFNGSSSACGVSSIMAPVLGAVTGDFSVSSNNLTTINIAATSIAGIFQFNDCPALTSFAFPNLQTVGDVTAFSNTGSFALNLPALTSFGSDVILTGSSITSVSCASLTMIGGGFNASAVTTITSVSMPVLSSVNGGDFDLTGCTGLTSVNFSSLTTVSGNLNIRSCSSLGGTLNLGALVSTGGDISLFANGITGLTLTSLTTVNSVLEAYNCTSLVSVSLPAVTGNTGGIYFYGNTAMTSLSLGGAAPNLVSNLDVHGCTVLATVSMPNLSFSDPGNAYEIFFQSCAIVAGNAAAGTGINGILHRCALSSLNSADIELNLGTNASPTGGAGNADYVALTGFGSSVLIN